MAGRWKGCGEVTWLHMQMTALMIIQKLGWETMEQADWLEFSSPDVGSCDQSSDSGARKSGQILRHYLEESHYYYFYL